MVHLSASASSSNKHTKICCFVKQKSTCLFGPYLSSRGAPQLSAFVHA